MNISASIPSLLKFKHTIQPSLLKAETKPSYKSINYKKHILIWALITTYLCMLDPLPGDLKVQIPATALIIFNYVFEFYALSLLVVPSIYRKKWLMAAGGLVMTIVVFFLVDIFNFNYLMPALGLDLLVSPIDRIIILDIKPFILVSLPAVAYFFNDLSLEKMAIQNEREKSLLIKELNFLKNQFNSHITFNFLNYCYSKVHQISEDTAEAIDIFSNMLRYSLTIKPETKVPIVKEIKYIEDFIELQKLLSSDVYVNFTHEGEFEGKQILPSLLITFIENAFSHGEFTRPSNPIIINLQAVETSITLYVSNKKRTRRHQSTGVGLENAKHLLQLYYPDKYDLQIENNVDDYSTRLKLSLD